MNNKEFSEGFDTLVNSYRRFRGFDNQEAVDSIEFDEFEKSFFLTKAQEEVVLSLYTGKNAYNDSFESTEEIRRYLSDLIVEKELSPLKTSTYKGVSSKSCFFHLPSSSKVWFITYEAVKISNPDKCNDGDVLEVVPATQDEYHRIKKNPFRGPNGRRALRLDLPNDDIEVVCKYSVTKYYLRYLRKLEPIVLENLPNNLTIESVRVSTPCTLHSALHQRVLERAVALGLQSKGYRLNNNTENN